MDTSSYEDQLANFSDLFKKSALPILIVSALITVGLGMHLITSPPEFRTDLTTLHPVQIPTTLTIEFMNTFQMNLGHYLFM